MNCSSCQKPIPDNKNYCRKCKEFTFPNASNDPDNPEVQWLSDAKIDVVQRIKTLTPDMDKFFGTPPGMARTCVTLLGGSPGAGKTTLMLQLADNTIEQYNGCCIYIANEQSAAEIRATAVRIKLKHLDKIGIVNAMGGLKSNLFELFHQYKPTLIVIDSLTKL